MNMDQIKNILNNKEKNIVAINKSALNDVDVLIFSWLSYFHLNEKVFKKNIFGSIPIKEIYNAKYLDTMLFDVTDILNSKKLLSLLAASPRFRDVEIVYYEELANKKREKQFSAMTFRIGKGKYVVAFRGTDHTFVGWKENLNMSFLKSIPAQVAAKNYLNKVMKKYSGTYYIGGHSKGGNLAVYASSFIDDKYKKRIKRIYNFDGPSLNSKLINDENYKMIKARIKKFVPQSSVVGMCFEKTSKYKIIKSNGIGLLQHIPFTWEIANNKLKILKNTTFDSKMFKAGINALVEDLSDEELKLFANSIYNVVNATKVKTFEEFLSDFNKNSMTVLKEINNFNDKIKETMKKVFKTYISEMFNIEKLIAKKGKA